METTNLIAIGFIIVIASFILGRITVKKKNRDNSIKPCNVDVTSKRTGIEYHAVEYRYRNNTIELKIYEHNLGDYKWYSIHHFKNALVIAYLVTGSLEIALDISSKKDLYKNFTDGNK